MIPRSMMGIDNLKWKIVEDLRQLEREKFAVKCFKQTMNYYPIIKDVKYSESAKNEGNRLYSDKDLDFTQLYKVLSHYNESIAYAPLDSELMATAYTNKTAVLLRMQRYDECMIEAEKALKITELTSLKIKLMCRKAECLTALGSDESRSCIEKARFHFTKLEESRDMREKMAKLIEKTQTIVDRQKLNIPKENKRRTHAIKLVDEVEKRDFSSCITTEYSEKFGRHLVAARDFEAGDIIAVEKPYFNHLHDSKVYQYCYHCFNHLWTVVPCDHCHWRLFCSEKCKNDAWNEYHELDCSLVCYLRVVYEQEWANRAFIPFIAGIFCKVFKEAGSIKKLLAVSEAMSKVKDSNDFASDTKYKTYQSIFTVPIAEFDDEVEYREMIRNSVLILIGIAKYTKILRKNYDFKDMKKLSKDDGAVLLGALVLKLTIIINSACPNTVLVDDREMCKDVRCQCKPPINPSYTILMLHALCQCIPNCESVRTYNNRNILYALQPIKAGTPLILWTRSSTVYDSLSRAERQATFYRYYNCPCECQACTEDWLQYLSDSQKLQGMIEEEKESPAAIKLWNDRNFIAWDWRANAHKPGYPDAKLLNKTIELAKGTWNNFTMPSAMIIRAVTLLLRIFIAFHNPCEIVSKVDLLRARQLGTVEPIDNEEKLKEYMAKMQIFS